ncbi:MAG: prephenate dehydratase [Alphaproteobacteria bacterium GM7ARS4]|nr:prephenate dehydratase [Alphaproteobacteria bacterium GM7ARS4]
MMAIDTPAIDKVAFQGLRGAYSHMACIEAYPQLTHIPCDFFYDVFHMVTQDPHCIGLIPVENSIAGRVSEIHQLLAHSTLHIIAEHYQPISHCLLALPTCSIEDIRTIKSHSQALMQCQDIIHHHRWQQVAVTDTAQAALDVSRGTHIHDAAIASSLAAKLYNLTILKTHIADTEHNTTRFIAVHAHPPAPHAPNTPSMASLVLRIGNTPSSLYTILGYFAQHAINLTRLEGIIADDRFTQAQFYIDVEGNAYHPPLKHVLAQLQKESLEFRLLGCYPASNFRKTPLLKTPSPIDTM